uniref:Uncharacterized protein n=1 Tax=Plectus sambesii TaxID=2011161 RepID=A0A914XCE3_9BILA
MPPPGTKVDHGGADTSAQEGQEVNCFVAADTRALAIRSAARRPPPIVCRIVCVASTAVGPPDLLLTTSRRVARCFSARARSSEISKVTRLPGILCLLYPNLFAVFDSNRCPVASGASSHILPHCTNRHRKHEGVRPRSLKAAADTTEDTIDRSGSERPDPVDLPRPPTAERFAHERRAPLRCRYRSLQLRSDDRFGCEERIELTRQDPLDSAVLSPPGPSQFVGSTIGRETLLARSASVNERIRHERSLPKAHNSVSFRTRSKANEDGEEGVAEKGDCVPGRIGKNFCLSGHRLLPFFSELLLGVAARRRASASI